MCSFPIKSEREQEKEKKREKKKINIRSIFFLPIRVFSLTLLLLILFYSNSLEDSLFFYIFLLKLQVGESSEVSMEYLKLKIVFTVQYTAVYSITH